MTEKTEKTEDGKIEVTALKQHLNAEGSHVEGDHYRIQKAYGEKLIAKGTVAAGHLDAKAVKAAQAKTGAPENKAVKAAETKA
ncbi:MULTISPECIES: hypothetical protein [unclassified Brevundimonas]|uniref:hypothetical protein n=1 Tax=unclassified Brevundimonas TaxID=2622653 RepID=UPI001432248D|nr:MULTISPECIES: hypothetical protein [unclassified Brevundimonas]